MSLGLPTPIRVGLGPTVSTTRVVEATHDLELSAVVAGVAV